MPHSTLKATTGENKAVKEGTILKSQVREGQAQPVMTLRDVHLRRRRMRR
jgi:hypothetical protein